MRRRGEKKKGILAQGDDTDLKCSEYLETDAQCQGARRAGSEVGGGAETGTEALINEGRRMWESQSDEGIKREETRGEKIRRSRRVFGFFWLGLFVRR